MQDACELPLNNATPGKIQGILARFHCIVVVGLSDNPNRDNHRVAL
jgi:predicted CoA-binding protein